MRTRQKQRIIIGVLCTIVIGLAIGYAVLSQTLNIQGIGGISGDFNIVFSDIKEDYMDDTTTLSTDGIGTDTLNIKMDMEKPGASADYIVTIENKGTYDAYINFITSDFKNEDFYYDVYDIDWYEWNNYGENIYLKKGESLQLIIEFGWRSSATTIPEEDIEFKIKIQTTQQPNYVGIASNTLEDATQTQLDLSETYNYMDGTYLKGMKQYGNYVWFDGFLWRIMGKNQDGSIRMITEENVTVIPWNEFAEKDVFENRSYEESYINDWLNNYFYSKLKDKDLIINSTWCSEMTEDEYSMRTTCKNNLFTTQQPVGTLSLDEFMLSGYSNKGNQADWFGASTWLRNRQVFYTLTSKTENTLWYIGGDGNSYSTNSLYFGNYENGESSIGIRPMINLKPHSMISTGLGTRNDPYIIGDKPDITGSLKDQVQVGEYVNFAGKNYRVMDMSQTGTKLILDGYYDPNNNGEIEDEEKFEYFPLGDRDNNVPYTETTLFSDINSDEVVNWIINNNEIDKNKMIVNTWYHGEEWGYNVDDSHDYKDSISDTLNPYVGRIGLVRVGEILAAQSETILSQNHTIENDWNKAEEYWTSNIAGKTTRYLNDNYLYHYIEDDGFVFIYSAHHEQALRPVIMISPDVQITSGNGTFNNPYHI